MHIEKNIVDNIFNTIMEVKGKTKDDENARNPNKGPNRHKRPLLFDRL